MSHWCSDRLAGPLRAQFGRQQVAKKGIQD